MRKGAELLLIKAMIRHDNTVCAAENTRIQTGLSFCFTLNHVLHLNQSQKAMWSQLNIQHLPCWSLFVTKPAAGGQM